MHSVLNYLMGASQKRTRRAARYSPQTSKAIMHPQTSNPSSTGPLNMPWTERETNTAIQAAQKWHAVINERNLLSHGMRRRRSQIGAYGVFFLSISILAGGG